MLPSSHGWRSNNDSRQDYGTISMSSSAASAPWEARRSIIWRAAAARAGARALVRLAMTTAHRTDRPASSGWAISSTRPTSRWCARAYALWRELEAASGRRLLTVTGIVEIGPPGRHLVRGTLASARLHELPPRGAFGAGADAALSRLSGFRRTMSPCSNRTADFSQPSRRFMRSSRSRAAAGADIRSGETVQRDRACARARVRVTTDRGIVEAGEAIVAAGRMDRNRCCPNCGCRLRVTRQVIGWFAPNDARSVVARTDSRSS